MRGKITAAAAAIVAVAGITGAGAASASTSTSAPAVPTATTIHFARGATSAHVAGRVVAGGDRRYTFAARAGQTATFHLARSTSAMTWTLVGPTGPSVHDAHSPRQSDFTYRLPTTGTYYVDIVSTRAASYDLSVSIPATTGAPTGTTTIQQTGDATSTAGQEIRFAPGSTAVRVAGGVGTTETAHFRFDAVAGQRATVGLEDITPEGTWTLVAPDGSPLHTAMTEQQGRATVTLPQTGTYRLDVHSPSGSTFTLSLSIPRH
ncbi:peptidase [Kineococcus aurantiacus]|uniref:Peptidase C-terminal archaeal/bacterial domain-containing protein n=1 Tax=Kineococcus aurantiacus TaxID=37633 RepID=A0A7Y9J355_9ACTN|nr:peptidase [Kineococcus aurantiacus]NYD24683.1 hypothetical protein [Kineococcus aurantiacus]